MNVNSLTHDVFQHATPLLVLWYFQGEEISGLLTQADEAVGGAISRAIDSGDLKGKVGESLLIYAAEGSDGAERVLLLGAGSREKFDAEAARRLSGQAVREAEKRSIDRITLGLAAVESLTPSALVQAVTEGGVLAAWDFRELKSGPGEGDGNEEEEPVTLVEALELGGDLEQDDVEEGVRVGVALGRGENLARTLQNRPGNVATPSHLAEEATKMAQEWGLSVRVLGPEEMRAEQMNALLAVAQGSVQEPRLIVLEHWGGGEGDPPLVLVGKGLTFDAGGISIKPAAKMEDMKFDMSGGAAVIGAMRAIVCTDLRASRHRGLRDPHGRVRRGIGESCFGRAGE
jgi:leucyl aminopeptidase